MNRPLLLSLVLVVSGAFAILMPLFFVLDFLFDLGGHSVDGTPVSRTEFYDSVDLKGLYFWGFCCVNAWAIWRRGAWSRHLILLMNVAPILYALVSGYITSARIPELIFGIPGIVYLAWYLFKKPNVVDYFTAPDIPLEDDGSKP